MKSKNTFVTDSRLRVYLDKQRPIGPIKFLVMLNMEHPATSGLQFRRRYTSEGINVYDMFEYDYRTSVIRNPTGEVVFEMSNVEVPKQWSQIATDILAQKYFRKAGVPQPDGSLGRETSAKQVAHRLGQLLEGMG